jgi:hypothetical protein
MCIVININIDKCEIRDNNFKRVSNDNAPFKVLGGAVFGYLANVNINDSDISENLSSEGGGIWIGTKANINNSVIKKNTARYGGGFYNKNIMESKDSTNLSLCIVDNNVAEIYGGGIYGDVTLISCRIKHNEALDNGGGVYSNSLQDISSCIKCNKPNDVIIV